MLSLFLLTVFGERDPVPPVEDFPVMLACEEPRQFAPDPAGFTAIIAMTDPSLMVDGNRVHLTLGMSVEAERREGVAFRGKPRAYHNEHRDQPCRSGRTLPLRRRLSSVCSSVSFRECPPWATHPIRRLREKRHSLPILTPGNWLLAASR